MPCSMFGVYTTKHCVLVVMFVVLVITIEKSVQTVCENNHKYISIYIELMTLIGH